MKLTFLHSDGPTKFTIELGEELTHRVRQYLAYIQEGDPRLRRGNLSEAQLIAKIVQHFLDDDDEFRTYTRTGKIPSKRGRRKTQKNHEEPSGSGMPGSGSALPRPTPPGSSLET